MARSGRERPRVSFCVPTKCVAANRSCPLVMLPGSWSVRTAIRLDVSGKARAAAVSADRGVGRAADVAMIAPQIDRIDRRRLFRFRLNRPLSLERMHRKMTIVLVEKREKPFVVRCRQVKQLRELSIASVGAAEPSPQDAPNVRFGEL